MFRLNLKELFKTRKKLTGSYTLKPDERGLPPDLGKIVEPVGFYFEITKEKGGYRIYMEIEGHVVLECSRCLTLYHKDISRKETIRIEPYPTRDVMYLKPSELDVSFLEDEEAFDLRELVREQIILSIPTKPLCSPECTPTLEEREEFKEVTLGDLLKKGNVL
ncbi:MAG: YceD family protein [Aquificaceae bacterium]|nr:YceD family protein [Aquificaceae bacterium]